ncbi:hypothetical protein [Burkholderia lata]|uniref:hypothetical protein n=1 Tax=Burkholderia lata (strain ATCC 17760 / DSM 23089 / LMG 22485 / NCIMB 9086 / R18194 / 383) TaxID=482957 RepID=UPI0012FD608E|nr:hypothetical protein [Burkholderia lata]
MPFSLRVPLWSVDTTVSRCRQSAHDFQWALRNVYGNPPTRLSRYPIPKSESDTFLIHVLTSPQVICFFLNILVRKTIDHPTTKVIATQMLKNENVLIEIVRADRLQLGRHSRISSGFAADDVVGTG